MEYIFIYYFMYHECMALRKDAELLISVIQISSRLITQVEEQQPFYEYTSLKEVISHIFKSTHI